MKGYRGAVVFLTWTFKIIMKGTADMIPGHGIRRTAVVILAVFSILAGLHGNGYA